MSTYRYADEHKLIAAVKKGEVKAQKELYERFASSMMAVCFRYVNDMETAKDLLQDGFVRVFTKLDDFAATGAFAGWVRRIFVTTCLEHLRQKHALRFSVSLETDSLTIPDEGASVVEQMSADDILQLIGQLSEGYRTVFNLYAIEGFSHAEIADMLGISEVTSRTQFLRARTQLQKMVLKLERKYI